VPDKIQKRVRAVYAERKLKALIKHAARCRDLDAFQERLGP
jgi:hypothetical protein